MIAPNNPSPFQVWNCWDLNTKEVTSLQQHPTNIPKRLALVGTKGTLMRCWNLISVAL